MEGKDLQCRRCEHRFKERTWLRGAQTCPACGGTDMKQKRGERKKKRSDFDEIPQAPR